MTAIIAGIDQGITLTGWAVGDGSRAPAAAAWRFDDIAAEDEERLFVRYRDRLAGLHTDFGFTHLIFEEPFIDRYRDKQSSLARRFGLDAILQLFCADHGVICEQAPWGALKRALGGSPKASKDDMVAGALKLGVALPKTKADGREDAADASAAWLIGVGHYARQHQAALDRRLYSARGALL